MWESAVKSAKSRLICVTKGYACTFEQYATLLTKIEGILNNRDLCVRRAGKQDGVVITLGYQITERYLMTTSELVNEPTEPPTVDFTASRWIEYHEIRSGPLII